MRPSSRKAKGKTESGPNKNAGPFAHTLMQGPHRREAGDRRRQNRIPKPIIERPCQSVPADSRFDCLLGIGHQGPADGRGQESIIKKLIWQKTWPAVALTVCGRVREHAARGMHEESRERWSVPWGHCFPDGPRSGTSLICLNSDGSGQATTGCVPVALGERLGPLAHADCME